MPAVAVERNRARGGGQRVQPQREALDLPEAAARPAEELAEVVAGDVLHDLPARARAQAVRQHDRDADHEVAHRAEAVAERAREIEEQAVAERRIAGRVEREPLPVGPERGLQLRQAQPGFDDAGQVARLVLEDPRLSSARQGRPSPADAHGRAPAPRRTGAASGRSSRGSPGPSGRTRAAGAASPRDRPRRTSTASRRPCRCPRRARR